ncbi:unnamed protein product [Sphagnum troendelagicum]
MQELVDLQFCKSLLQTAANCGKRAAAGLEVEVLYQLTLIKTNPFLAASTCAAISEIQEFTLAVVQLEARTHSSMP